MYMRERKKKKKRSSKSDSESTGVSEGSCPKLYPLSLRKCLVIPPSAWVTEAREGRDVRGE